MEPNHYFVLYEIFDTNRYDVVMINKSKEILREFVKFDTLTWKPNGVGAETAWNKYGIAEYVIKKVYVQDETQEEQ